MLPIPFTILRKISPPFDQQDARIANFPGSLLFEFKARFECFFILLAVSEPGAGKKERKTCEETGSS